MEAYWDNAEGSKTTLYLIQSQDYLRKSTIKFVAKAMKLTGVKKPLFFSWALILD